MNPRETRETMELRREKAHWDEVKLAETAACLEAESATSQPGSNSTTAEIIKKTSPFSSKKFQEWLKERPPVTPSRHEDPKPLAQGEVDLPLTEVPEDGVFALDLVDKKAPNQSPRLGN